MTANDHYERGNELRREGRFGEAISAYMEAIALDPNSPAVEAKEMLDSIMSFYCKDYYNP